MRVAVIGSRNLIVKNLKKYLPEDTSELLVVAQWELTTMQGCML